MDKEWIKPDELFGQPSIYCIGVITIMKHILKGKELTYPTTLKAELFLIPVFLSYPYSDKYGLLCHSNKSTENFVFFHPMLELIAHIFSSC